MTDRRNDSPIPPTFGAEVSALGTPGADPITPLFMFVPLYVFYVGTALLLKLTGR